MEPKPVMAGEAMRDGFIFSKGGYAEVVGVWKESRYGVPDVEGSGNAQAFLDALEQWLEAPASYWEEDAPPLWYYLKQARTANAEGRHGDAMASIVSLCHILSILAVSDNESKVAGHMQKPLLKTKRDRQRGGADKYGGLEKMEAAHCRIERLWSQVRGQHKSDFAAAKAIANGFRPATSVKTVLRVAEKRGLRRGK